MNRIVSHRVPSQTHDEVTTAQTKGKNLKILHFENKLNRSVFPVWSQQGVQFLIYLYT